MKRHAIPIFVLLAAGPALAARAPVEEPPPEVLLLGPDGKMGGPDEHILFLAAEDGVELRSWRSQAFASPNFGALPDLAVPSGLVYPFVDRQGIGEQTYMIQLMGEAEKAKILADEKSLVDDLCTYRDVLGLTAAAPTPSSHHR
jgi:hypothetical protein